MLSSDRKEYWTPVDEFILRVVNKYGSLAMIGPRIQSPYDLINAKDINSTVRKFRFTKYLKEFYKGYLAENNIMKFDLYHERMEGKADKKILDSFTREVSDVSLMKHPPILGHWLKESGFITEANMKHKTEFTYDEYKNLFTTNPDQNLKMTRRRLYPSFEGLLVTDSFIGRTRNVIDEKCFQEVLSPKIYALIESVHFNQNSGEFDIYKPEQIYKFTFERDMTHEKNLVTEDFIYSFLLRTNDKDRLIPLSIFNDRTYTPADENQGFFNTNIAYAYHMNFDLNASYELKYNPDAKLGTRAVRIRKYNSINNDTMVAGRLQERDCIDESRLIMAKTDSHLEGILSKMSDIGVKLCADSDEKFDEPEFLEKIDEWKTFPIIDSNPKVLRDQSVYSSFYDYYWHDTYINDIMDKKMVNYFWFMYGALPTNGIYYEDLKEGLEENSFLDLDKSFSDWDAEAKSEIFEYNRGTLALEGDKDRLILVYRQTIKFLALVWNLKESDLGDILNIPMYFIPSMGRSIAAVNVKFEVLNSIYPKITSSLYVETKTEKEIVPKNDYEKNVAAGIIIKLRSNIDLSENDYDFMYRTNILKDSDKARYDKMGKKIDTSNIEYKNLKFSVESNIDRVEDFMKRPLIENDVIPTALLNIASEIKFPCNGLPISQRDKNVIRRIYDYILDESSPPKYVWHDMISYLYSWKIIRKNYADEFSSYYIASSTGPGDAKRYRYLRLDQGEIPGYEAFKAELRSFKVQDDDKLKDITAIEVSNKDSKVTVRNDNCDKPASCAPCNVNQGKNNGSNQQQKPQNPQQQGNQNQQRNQQQQGNQNQQQGGGGKNKKGRDRRRGNRPGGGGGP